MAQSMKYEVFISYTTADREWARKLYDDLDLLGIPREKIFFAPKGIEVGDEWRASLMEALEQSRCFILLWSKNAKGSEWVVKEANVFDAWRYKAPAERRLLQLNLEQGVATLANLQAIDLNQDAAFDFAAGASKVDAWLWHEAMVKLAEQIVHPGDRNKMNLVILAATKREIEDMVGGKVAAPFGLTPLIELWSHVDPAFDVANVKDFYGAKPTDWCPFRGTANILSLLAGMRNDILARGARRFLWDLASEDFWTMNTNDARFQLFKDNLEKTPSVIVIDGISLYHGAIWQRSQELIDCFKNKNAAIMVVSPVSFTPRATMREALQRAIRGYHDQYYNLKVGVNRAPAQCDLLIPDDFEMKRVLANTLSEARSHWATSQA
jgi:hypothetical protein